MVNVPKFHRLDILFINVSYPYLLSCYFILNYAYVNCSVPCKREFESTSSHCAATLDKLLTNNCLWGSVALGTTTIDSTPAIGVRWRRVPIQPAKYLHQWLSVKLVRTGFQNSGPLFRITKG